MLVHLEYLDSELVQPPELQQPRRVGFAKQALLLEWQPGFAPQQQLDSQPVVLEVARPIKKKGSYQKQECTMRLYIQMEKLWQTYRAYLCMFLNLAMHNLCPTPVAHNRRIAKCASSTMGSSFGQCTLPCASTPVIKAVHSNTTNGFSECFICFCHRLQ